MLVVWKDASLAANLVDARVVMLVVGKVVKWAAVSVVVMVSR